MLLQRNIMQATQVNYTYGNVQSPLQKLTALCTYLWHRKRWSTLSFLNYVCWMCHYNDFPPYLVLQIGSCGKCGNQTEAKEEALNQEDLQYGDIMRLTNHAVKHACRWLHSRVV